MYNIAEFIILPQKLVFLPNLLFSTHSNCSTPQKCLLLLANNLRIGKPRTNEKNSILKFLTPSKKTFAC